MDARARFEKAAGAVLGLEGDGSVMEICFMTGGNSVGHFVLLELGSPAFFSKFLLFKALFLFFLRSFDMSNDIRPSRAPATQRTQA